MTAIKQKDAEKEAAAGEAAPTQAGGDREPVEQAEEGGRSEHFQELSVDDTLKELSADPENGLTEDEVEKRREKYGRNAIEEKRRNIIVKALSHFWGPIPWMIEIALILAAVLQRWEDVAVIGLMLLVNGGVGFWHESKADQAIQALKKSLALNARVIRGGEEKKVPAADLVPGDIIFIRMGEVVPADAILLEDQELSADESALTGESLPVEKQAGDVCYSGSPIKRGEARAVVVATGASTKFGRTVELVASAQELSHFQQAVMRIGYFLIGLTAALVIVVCLYAIFVRQDTWTNVILFGLALTLAGIPAALPAVLSVTMSVGAGRLAKMKAIVAKLASMEEMAGLDILCADKTGTLTKNQLELQDPVVLEAENEQDLILAAALTSERDDPDPIDSAILNALEDKDTLSRYEILEFEPFDPTRKRADAKVKADGTEFRVSKGAPQAILDLIEAGDDLREQVNQRVNELGQEGYRALGVARSGNEGHWSYLGVLALLDPPREDSKNVIADAQHHGIDVRMITGDHVAIARQVAKQVGLGDDIREAGALFKKDDAARDGKKKRGPRTRRGVLKASGFAEVTPEDKFDLIRAFQAGDRIVGMTGDGVNDAPALSQADVGIAVASATDAARAAAALVLTEEGLGVILRAIEEARRIFERMTSYATFRSTETMHVLLFVSLSILIFGFFPVEPIMIVLLAILNDIPIMSIAWDNVRTPHKPVRWDMPRVLTLATMLAIGGVVESLILLWYVHAQLQVPMEELKTIMFLNLLVAGHMTIFVSRSRNWMVQRPWPSLWLLGTLETTQIVGTLFAVYGVLVTPIGWIPALGVWGYALVWIFLFDALKLLTLRILSQIRREQPLKRPPAGHPQFRERQITECLESIEETLEENNKLLAELVRQREEKQ